MIDAALLHILLEEPGPHTPTELAQRVQLDTDAIRDRLDGLRRAGCNFDQRPDLGVTLVRTGLGAWVDYLDHRLAAPGRVTVYGRTQSTQDVARRIAEHAGAAADGAVVVADEQTGGRGRLGRRWVAPPGSSVMFSRIHRIAEPAGRDGVDRFGLAANVAIAETLAGHLPGVRIKWPNDVLVDGRKVAGVLVETARTALGERVAIIGVGINVDVPPDAYPPDAHATCLTRLGAPVDRLALLAETIERLDTSLDHTAADQLLERWRTLSSMLHRQVRLRSNGREIEGEVVDLDPYDGLILRSHDGAMLHLPAATTTVV